MSDTRSMDPAEMPPTQLRSRSSVGLWVAIALLALAGGGFWYWRTHQPAPLAPVAPVESQKLAPVAAPPVLSLDEGDAKLRELASGLSTSPKLLAWLKEGNLIRRLASAVGRVAEGESPRQMLSFFAPEGDFQVVEERGKLHASPKCHARYDEVTHLVTAIDAAKAGRAYGTLRPYFQAAYAEFAPPGAAFDTALHGAIQRMVETPVPEAEPELKTKGALYAYADPALEGLSAAQKHLLRMGATNARALQAWFRAFEQAVPKAP